VLGLTLWCGHVAQAGPPGGRQRSSTVVLARHVEAPAGRSAPLGRSPAGLESQRDSAAILIQNSEYRPFFKNREGPDKITVSPFLLDAVPVTRAAYHAFVLEHSTWQKSRVKTLFAEASYLADWPSDFDPGRAAPDAPVTFVSWFAAKAYCASVGKRLPSVVEWEAFAQTELGARVLGLARVEAGATVPALPATFEWISDFNSVLVTGGGPGDDASSLFCGAGARATDARDYQAFLRYSFRSSLKASFALKRLGFRCAKDAP
jgi:formylglycine-generating enzyme required for sulfatase activity